MSFKIPNDASKIMDKATDIMGSNIAVNKSKIEEIMAMRPSYLLFIIGLFLLTKHYSIKNIALSSQWADVSGLSFFIHTGRNRHHQGHS
jgi:hypothetical protein